MEQNLDAEMLYAQFTKSILKCKNDYTAAAKIIGEYNGKLLAMKYAPISFKFANFVNKMDWKNVLTPEQYVSIIRSHGEIVIKSGDSDYNYWFASLVTGSDVEKHDEMVSKSGNAEMIKKIGQRKIR